MFSKQKPVKKTQGDPRKVSHSVRDGVLPDSEWDFPVVTPLQELGDLHWRSTPAPWGELDKTPPSCQKKCVGVVQTHGQGGASGDFTVQVLPYLK